MGKELRLQRLWSRVLKKRRNMQEDSHGTHNLGPRLLCGCSCPDNGRRKMDESKSVQSLSHETAVASQDSIMRLVGAEGQTEDAP
jgi:hypothetical protein